MGKAGARAWSLDVCDDSAEWLPSGGGEVEFTGTGESKRRTSKEIRPVRNPCPVTVVVRTNSGPPRTEDGFPGDGHYTIHPSIHLTHHLIHHLTHAARQLNKTHTSAIDASLLTCLPQVPDPALLGYKHRYAV